MEIAISVHIDHTPTRLHEYVRIALPGLSEDKELVLVGAYCERWRTYHNCHHIWQMIEEADARFKHELSLRYFRILLCMFGYHDVVLKIKRETGWNERESAAYAERDMQAAGEDEEFIIYVMTGIIATITHSLAQVLAKYHYLVSILLDLDLKGIGDGWDYFQLNTEAIWLEYMPHYTRSEYDAGRKHWAAGFLNRSQIFYTDDYRHLEEQARVNLTRLAAN